MTTDYTSEILYELRVHTNHKILEEEMLLYVFHKISQDKTIFASK